jgi:hypothetical protein
MGFWHALFRQYLYLVKNNYLSLYVGVIMKVCIHRGDKTNDLYTIDGGNRNSKEASVPVCRDCDSKHH